MIQTSVVLLILGHVILGVAALDSQTCEAIIPTDTTARLGQKAVLKCRLSSQNIAWTFCPRNGGPSLIATNCAVVKSAAGTYRVDTTANSCNLIVDNVTASHLGTYRCQDLSLNDPGHVVHLGNSQENLALRKNSIQPSRYSNFDVSRAFDGNLDARYPEGSCAVNEVRANSWMAVDLEQEIPIGRVRITRRADDTPDYLKDFFIGVTNVSPWVSPPLMNQSSTCKYFAGSPPPATPIDIFCEPNTLPGRYLFVLAYRVTYLSICELEAYYE